MQTRNREIARGALMARGLEYAQAGLLLDLADDAGPGRTFGGPAAMVSWDDEPPTDGYTVAGDGKPAARPLYAGTELVRTGLSGRPDPGGAYVTIRSLSGQGSWNTIYSVPELIALGGQVAEFIAAEVDTGLVSLPPC